MPEPMTDEEIRRAAENQLRLLGALLVEARAQRELLGSVVEALSASNALAAKQLDALEEILIDDEDTDDGEPIDTDGEPAEEDDEPPGNRLLRMVGGAAG